VEDATRIRRIFLEALEEERFDELPPDVYARGFLRNYARFLGLDPDPLLKAFHPPRARPTLKLPAVLDEPLRQSKARNIGAAIFWGLVVVVIVGLALWYGYHEFYLGTAWGPKPTPSVVPVETLPVETPTPMTIRAESQPTDAPSPTSTLAATSEPSETTTDRPAATSSPTSAVALTHSATATAPSPSPTGVTPLAPTATATTSAGPTRSTPSLEDGIPVTICVSAQCYVYVAVDGAKVMETILDQGDEETWAFRRTFMMRLGNAGAVQITLNGVDLAPVGKLGQVVNVEYTADNLPLN